MSSIGELACIYACLILHDDDIPINAERIDTLIKAANLKVESYWPSLFAKLCQKVNVDELIMNVGAGGTTTSNNAAPPPPTTDDGASTAPSAHEKKKEELKEESDDEAMFSLFD